MPNRVSSKYAARDRGRVGAAPASFQEDQHDNFRMFGRREAHKPCVPAGSAGFSCNAHFLGSRELCCSLLYGALESFDDELKVRRLLRISQTERKRSISFSQGERSHSNAVFADAHELDGLLRRRLLNGSSYFSRPLACQ